MNRHARRAQEAVNRKARKHFVAPKGVSFAARQSFEYSMKAILRAKAPIRFFIMDKCQKEWINNLLGFKVSLDRGTMAYTIWLGGKKLGTFT